MYERLLREHTSDRELIYEFVTSKVDGCKTERVDARLRCAARGCTNEARVVRDDISPESSLARLSLGWQREAQQWAKWRRKMKDRRETPHLIPMAIPVLRTSHTLCPHLVSDVRLQTNESDERERNKDC